MGDRRGGQIHGMPASVDDEHSSVDVGGRRRRQEVAYRGDLPGFGGPAQRHVSGHSVQTFSGEEQAVSMANNTRFGLAATLVTGDRERAERVSSLLNAGTVWVNCFFVRDLGAPFGGNGKSGIGREGGTFSFDFYCDVKNTVFAPEGWR